VADRRSHEKTGLYIFTGLSYWGADRRRKIGGLPVPVVAASQIVGLHGADRIQLKSGMGIPEINQKDEPSTRYKIRLRSGAIGKNVFTSRE
jgi:hypothetical protein